MSMFKETGDDSNKSHQHQTEEEKIESYVQKLVETRGEQWKDPETIAKGKLEADRYIEEWKRKNEELSRLGEQSEKIDSLIELVRQQTKGNSTDSRPDNTATGGASDPDRTGPDLTNEQIKALVAEQLKEYDSTNTRRQNLAFAEESIRKVYGDTAPAVIKNTAAEVGMSVSDLEEMAASNPRAFIKLVSGNQPSKPGMSYGGGVRSEAVGQNKSSGRNFAYYQKIRKDSRAKYNSVEVQKQMLQDRLEMGDKFYET